MLPAVEETCSTAQFTCPVFCQCSADGGDYMSKLMATKIAWKILCLEKASHKLKKNQLKQAKKWWKGGWWLRR